MTGSMNATTEAYCDAPEQSAPTINNLIGGQRTANNVINEIEQRLLAISAYLCEADVSHPRPDTEDGHCEVEPPERQMGALERMGLLQNDTNLGLNNLNNQIARIARTLGINHE